MAALRVLTDVKVITPPSDSLAAAFSRTDLLHPIGNDAERHKNVIEASASKTFPRTEEIEARWIEEDTERNAENRQIGNDWRELSQAKIITRKNSNYFLKTNISKGMRFPVRVFFG